MLVDRKPKILIVEDEMIIAAYISIELSKLNYEVIGINTQAEDAIATVKNNRPDLILMDVWLDGSMDGITAAEYIYHTFHIPVVFLTGSDDDNTFQRAMATRPYDYIVKPLQPETLKRTLKMVFNRVNINPADTIPNLPIDENELFVREKNQMKKLLIDDIFFVEADGKQCRVVTNEKELNVATALSFFANRLPEAYFIKVHRSYIVNIKKIDAISQTKEYLTIVSHIIPISRRNKKVLLDRLRMV